MLDSVSEQPRHSNDPAESLDDDHNTSRDSDDTLIASPGEDGTAERPTPSVFQNIPVKKQNNGSELISVGPRPLMLGTFQIATLSPATSSNSRPASSLPPAPRTPTSPSARWSSYTPPLTPLSPISSSPILDEVEFLKAQLAASEAMVKVLMKEKFEAVSASRRLTVDLKNLQDEQSQWSKEKEEIMAKLRAVDEDEATLPLSPPSEGAWFGGSSKTRQLPKKQPILPSLASISGHDRDMQTPPLEAPQLPEVRVSPPGSASSDDHSESALNEIYDTSSENSPRTSAGEETLSRIGTIFLDSGPFDDGCDPSNNPSNNPSPTTTPTASYFPSIEYLSPSSCLSPPPNAKRWSHQRGAAVDGSQFIPPTVQYVTPPSQISLSNSSPRTSFNALGVSSIPGSPLHLLVPLSGTRSVTPPPQIRPPRPDLMALAYQLIGMDPCSGYPGRQALHAHARSLLTEGNGTANTGPSINLATALDLHAPMTRVAASSGRPRSASSSPIWLANNEPQIELYLNPLRRSASTTGPKTRYSFSSLGRRSLRRSSTNRRSASVNEHATVESLHKRPSPLRMRSFMPSSSPLVTAPVDSGETQPKKKTRLSKLLEQGRSLVSRIV